MRNICHGPTEWPFQGGQLEDIEIHHPCSCLMLSVILIFLVGPCFVCMVVDLGWRMAHVELLGTVGNTYRYGMMIVLSSVASCPIMFA